MKITIILPVYNRASLVSRAIESVLNQSYRNFELIVVDDGSTDAIDEVMGRFDDPRIIYMKLGQNRGVSVARNIGLERCSGEAICFLDSDDEFQPQYLLKMSDRMLQGYAHIVACSALYSDGISYPTETQLRLYEDAEDKYAYLLGGNIFPLPCFLFNVKIKNYLFFNVDYTAYEDYAMLLDILGSSNEILILKEDLVNVHNSEEGVNKNYDGILNTLDLLQIKHEKKMRKNRSARYNFLKNIFGIARLAGRKRKITIVLLKMLMLKDFYFDLYSMLPLAKYSFSARTFKD